MDLPIDPGYALPGAAPMEVGTGMGHAGVALAGLDEVLVEARAAWAPFPKLVLRLEGELAVWAENGRGLLGGEDGQLDQRISFTVRWTPIEKDAIHAGLYGRLGEWSATGVGDAGIVVEGGWAFLRGDVSLPLAYGAFGAGIESVGLLPPQVWRTSLEAGVAGRVAAGQWVRVGVTGGVPWLTTGWNGHIGAFLVRLDVAGDPGWGASGPKLERVRVMVGRTF